MTEPIIIQKEEDYQSFYDRHTGDIFCVKLDPKEFAGYVCCDNGGATAHWAIHFSLFLGGNHSYFIYNGARVSREEFFDYLRDNHPKHFEWLLFHPEWLK